MTPGMRDGLLALNPYTKLGATWEIPRGLQSRLGTMLGGVPDSATVLPPPCECRLFLSTSPRYL